MRSPGLRGGHLLAAVWVGVGSGRTVEHAPSQDVFGRHAGNVFEDSECSSSEERRFEGHDRIVYKSYCRLIIDRGVFFSELQLQVVGEVPRGKSRVEWERAGEVGSVSGVQYAWNS